MLRPACYGEIHCSVLACCGSPTQAELTESIWYLLAHPSDYSSRSEGRNRSASVTVVCFSLHWATTCVAGSVAAQAVCLADRSNTPSRSLALSEMGLVMLFSLLFYLLFYFVLVLVVVASCAGKAHVWL